MAEDFIKFLGTAGARFVTATQLRYSAGTFISMNGRRVIVDPGPGTLVRCAKSRPRIDPRKIHAIVLTHGHIDHSGDVNAMLDAMTWGGFEPGGQLFAPVECLEGEDAVVLRYLRQYLDEVSVLRAESHYSIGPLEFDTSVRHRHTAETYGLKFRLNGRTIAFLVDTQYFDGLIDAYRDADVLVVNVVRKTPFQGAEILHLTLDDARRVIAGVRPQKAVITHLGMTMLKAKPREVALRLSDELGLEVVAATDGMTLPLDEPRTE